MSVRHHLPEDWIVAAAAGTNSPARALLIEVHRTLCPQCRALLALGDGVAQAVLDDGEALPLTPNSWAELEARLSDDQTVSPLPPSEWPAPVAPFVEGQRWRWLAPGVSGITIPLATEGEMPLRMMRMRGGRALPHRDGGEEAAVLLRGGWTDQGGHYRAGDVYYAPEGGALHQQVIDPGEDCVALVLNAAPVVLPQRWMRWFFRL